MAFNRLDITWIVVLFILQTLSNAHQTPALQHGSKVRAAKCTNSNPIIQNGGFESNKLAPWILTPTSDSDTVGTFTTSKGENSKLSAQITITTTGQDGGEVYFYENFHVCGKTTYEFGWSQYVVPGSTKYDGGDSNHLYLAVDFNDPDYGSLSYEEFSIYTDKITRDGSTKKYLPGQWYDFVETYSLDPIKKSGNAFLRFTFIVIDDSYANATVRFDNIFFREK